MELVESGSESAGAEDSSGVEFSSGAEVVVAAGDETRACFEEASGSGVSWI